MSKWGFLLWAALCLLGGGLAQAQKTHEQQPQVSREQSQPQQSQEQLQLREEVTVRWWLVPVYAVDKSGAPILNLTPDDVEVYIKDIRVEKFDIHKKQFQVSETKRGVAPASKPQPPPQKKMVFLVFDAVYSSFNLLAKAKAIAETAIAQADQTAQYVLLTIEPFEGLHYILGPTRDLRILAQHIKKYVEGKKVDLGGGMFPGMRGGGKGGARDEIVSNVRNQIEVETTGGTDWMDKRRVAGSYASALMTLDVVLGLFRDYSKVIYLYSCGIPGDALLDRMKVTEPNGPDDQISGIPNVKTTIHYSLDSVAYDTLRTIGAHFNKSGALLFIVNPQGTRKDEFESDSGEASLRILTSESGGRYFEGAEKDIAVEVNNMERGYYEISFPDKAEYEGQELNFEVRSKKPGVQVFSVKKVGRQKTFADMTELEREVTVMNVLNEGPFSRAGQKVSYVAADASRNGDKLDCRMRLPEEMARREWVVYKIARNFATGRMFMDKEVIVPTTASVEIRMKWRGKDFRHDLVLAHTKTGTILVWK